MIGTYDAGGSQDINCVLVLPMGNFFGEQKVACYVRYWYKLTECSSDARRIYGSTDVEVRTYSVRRKYLFSHTNKPVY